MPVISIAGPSAHSTEGATITFTLTASPAPTADLPVDVNVTNETGKDFLASGEAGVRTVTIAANTTTKTFDVDTEDDAVEEANGSISAIINSGTGYTLPSDFSHLAIAIVRDNDTPTVGITVGGGDLGSVAEGGSLTITATRSAANTSGTALTIPILVSSTSHTTAQAADYTVASSISIPNNSATGTTTFMAADDNLDELDETVRISLDGTNLPEGTVSDSDHYSIDITITDTDVPVISVTQNGDSIIEGSGFEVDFEIGSDLIMAADLVVNVRLAQTSDFFDEDDLGDQTVTILRGNDYGDLQLTPINDDVDEADGMLTFTVLAGTDYTLGSTLTDTATIEDDDDPAISFAEPPAGGYQVAEGGHHGCRLLHGRHRDLNHDP